MTGIGRSTNRRLLGLAIFAALAGPSIGSMTGCETSCSVDGDPDPEVVEDGVTDPERGSYESTPWDGEYRKFPPKKRYEFRHGLGHTPRGVFTYVSFSRTPLKDAEFGNVAESAGNIAIIEAVTPEYIRVRNDTCETFYLRVYANDPDDREDGPSADAGSGGMMSTTP